MRKYRSAIWMTASLIGLFLLVEVGLRATLGLGTPPLLQADSAIGYLYQANQDVERFGNRVRINRYHQRSEPLSSTPDSSLLRVLFLGDSVTWGGVLVEQKNTYPEVFEAAANLACTRPVEALNASAGSWGIGNLKAYLERFGIFDSDIVVLQIGSHDLLQPTSNAAPVGEHPAFPAKNPLLATQELLMRYLWPRYVKPLVAKAETASSHPDSSEAAAQFTQNMQMLSEMVGGVRGKGARPYLLHTPNREEVVAGADGAFATRYAAYRARFHGIADSLNVPVIDLHRRWQGAPKAAGYFRDGVHLSTTGNEVVGGIVERRVIQRPRFDSCRADS